MRKQFTYIVVSIILLVASFFQLDAQGTSNSFVNFNVNFLSFDLGPDTAICHGNCVYLEGPSDMLSYTWFEDGIYYSSNPSIEPCPTDTTEYSLFVIDQFSVSDWDTIQINVWPTPVVEIHPSDTTISLGDCVELFGAIGNYTWVWDSLGIQIGTSTNITVCPIDTTQYNQIATNIYGCSGEDSTFVYINFLSFDLGPDITICDGNCDSIIGPPGMADYTWYVADTIFDTVQIIVPCPNDATQYTLWVEDSLGATASDSIVVNVLTSPIANIQPSNTTIPENSCVNLIGTEGDYIYEWFIGELPIGSTQIITVCPDDTTQYNLVITNEYECSDEDSTFVNIEFLSFSLGPDQTICENSCFEIVGPDGMVEYEWSIGDSILPEITSSFYACPLEETQYILTVIDGYGATASDSIVLYLKQNPIVDFEDDSLYVSLGNNILITANFDVFSGQPFFTWLYNDESKVTFIDNYYNLINPDTSDYVYVELQADNMCTAVDSAYITVLEFPEISVSNDTTVCSNQTVMLEVTGGKLFLWIVDNDTISTDSVITVSPEVTTSYIAQTAYANSANYSMDTVVVTIFNTTETKILYDTNTVCTYAEIELAASGAEHYMWVPSEDTNDVYIFSIIDTTTISLMGTNDDGCFSIDSTTFYNIPAPIVSFTGLLPIFCENDSYVSLTGIPNGGIYSGEGIVGDRFYPENTGAGIHEVVYEYINTENCVGYDTNSTIIYGNGGSINLGFDFTLKYDSSKLLDAGAGFDSYFWTTGATTQSITVHGNEKPEGVYEYAVMGVINGCSTRGNINIAFEKLDGISEQHISGFAIFPNPNKGNFTVKFSSIEKNIKLKIYSVQGLLIYELNDISCAEDCTVDIQLNNVEPGFYFIKIITPYGISTDKIILK